MYRKLIPILSAKKRITVFFRRKKLCPKKTRWVYLTRDRATKLQFLVVPPKVKPMHRTRIGLWSFDLKTFACDHCLWLTRGSQTTDVIRHTFYIHGQQHWCKTDYKCSACQAYPCSKIYRGSSIESFSTPFPFRPLSFPYPPFLSPPLFFFSSFLQSVPCPFLSFVSFLLFLGSPVFPPIQLRSSSGDGLCRIDPACVVTQS